MDTLTNRQRVVLDALRKRDENNENPPTLDELCSDLGLRSRGSMHKHVQALIDKGWVEPMQGLQRGVRLAQRRTNKLPLLGRIAAGLPMDAIEDARTIEVPAFLKRDEGCFVLEVDGDSMFDEGILDGDLVVIEGRSDARSGDIVVALIDGAETTLKRLRLAAGGVTLEPANDAFEPLTLSPDRVQIQGVLVGQMRRY